MDEILCIFFSLFSSLYEPGSKRSHRCVCFKQWLITTLDVFNHSLFFHIVSPPRGVEEKRGRCREHFSLASTDQPHSNPGVIFHQVENLINYSPEIKVYTAVSTTLVHYVQCVEGKILLAFTIVPIQPTVYSNFGVVRQWL